jgi:hypothetical protein
MSTAKADRPRADHVAAGDNSMKPLTAYFNDLKARLDAYSKRRVDEMDRYQNRKAI